MSVVDQKYVGVILDVKLLRYLIYQCVTHATIELIAELLTGML